MKLSDTAIPAPFLWSSPFVRWQGRLAEVPSLDLAAAVTGRALADRGVPADRVCDLVDGILLGWTVPQPDLFYGAPTLAGRIGAPLVTGAMVSQACATSVAALGIAATAVAAGAGPQLVVVADRVSNGPLLSFPHPSGMGGAPQTTHWVLDAFARDPWAGTGMIEAGDLVAAENGFTRQQADELTLLRHEQYARALADDRAFQRHYQVPVEIPGGKGRGLLVAADEGVRPALAATIAGLPVAADGGIHSYAAQTHPADGTAGAVVTTVVRARELAAGAPVVELLATGTARVGRTRMPEAPVPAALAALADSGLDIAAVDAVTTHNPFAVNDLYFSAQTGVPLERMNAYGCSLVFGHPQAPTGLRSVAELVTELWLRGGGVGLFAGCAAGDTGMALVLRVTG